MESGAMLFSKDRVPISYDEALNDAKQLALKVNCTDEKQWFACLRKANVKDIIDNYKNNKEVQFPVYRTEFLPISANEAFAQGKYNKGIMMMSFKFTMRIRVYNFNRITHKSPGWISDISNSQRYARYTPLRKFITHNRRSFGRGFRGLFFMTQWKTGYTGFLAELQT